MSEAIKEAEKAYSMGEVPVGAVLLNEHAQIIARAHNLKEKTANPLGHAELLAIGEASQKLHQWRLLNSTLVVTLEPCSMCLSAIIHARIKRVVFGAYDLKSGAISIGLNLHQHPKLNHRVEIIGGLRHYENSRLLSQFFRERRQGHLTFTSN